MRGLLTRASIAVMMAVALIGGVPATANAAAHDNCHGYVSHLYKSSGKIYAHYRVECSVKQDWMFATARLVAPWGVTYRGETVYCSNSTWCAGIVSVTDRAGSQKYLALSDPDHFVGTSTERDGYIVYCGSVSSGHSMICAAKSGTF